MNLAFRCSPIATMLAALLAAAGCAHNQKAETAAAAPAPAKVEVPATAQPVPGWDGMKSVSRSGRFTFAGQPNEAALDRFAAEGGVLVIDLRTHEGKDTAAFDEQARVEKLGMKYEQIPVSPATLSAADVDKLAHAAQTTQGPILVHCATSNRVGALWAAYLAREKGVPADDAIAAGKAAGMHSPEAEQAARRVIGH